jgi:hypothetical protein
MDIELVQLFDGELLSLPQEILAIGREVPEPPPRKMLAKRLLQRVIRHVLRLLKTVHSKAAGSEHHEAYVVRVRDVVRTTEKKAGKRFERASTAV